MKNRTFIILLTFLFMCFFFGVFKDISRAQDQNTNKRETLVFLSWADYIDPNLIKEFESKHNAQVKQVYYESDELKDEMLLSSDGKGYDIVLGSGISLIPYLKRDWIIPLDSKSVPNIKQIHPRWLNAHPEIAGYAIPYLWGSLGIAYRTDLIKRDIKSWMGLFRPKEDLRGKIIMIEDSQDVIGAALKALGYSLNSITPQHYDEVERLLLAQKPYVADYSYVALTEECVLVTGKAWMAMVYNGDALLFREINPKISFVLPQEGTSLWIDYLVVMNASRHKKLAMNFINFLNEPENAARLASYSMYATPNRAAEKFLSKDYLENPAIYPSKKIIEKSEFARKLPPRIVKRRNSIFSQVTD